MKFPKHIQEYYEQIEPHPIGSFKFQEIIIDALEIGYKNKDNKDIVMMIRTLITMVHVAKGAKEVIDEVAEIAKLRNKTMDTIISTIAKRVSQSHHYLKFYANGCYDASDATAIQNIDKGEHARSYFTDSARRMKKLIDETEDEALKKALKSAIKEAEGFLDK